MHILPLVKANGMKFYFLSILGCLVIPCELITAQSDWTFKKEANRIKVYYRESADSRIKELKATLQVKGSLGAATHFITNAEQFPDWVFQCREGKVLKKITQSDLIYYNLANFPWPLSDREFILRCTTYQEPETLVVHSLASSASGFLPENKQYVRVQLVESNFKLTPMDDGMIAVEYYLKSNPGGFIPAWAVNWALDLGPVKSLTKFRELVQSEIYRGFELPFIREP